MKLWCDNCKEAVEPIVRREKEFHDEVDTRCYEEYDVYTCPTCGQEIYDEPNACALCGEWCDPDEEFCEICKEDLERAVDTIARVHGWKSAMEALNIYTSEVA